jgi:hypothetical protein
VGVRGFRKRKQQDQGEGKVWQCHERVVLWAIDFDVRATCVVQGQNADTSQVPCSKMYCCTHVHAVSLQQHD